MNIIMLEFIILSSVLSFCYLLCLVVLTYRRRSAYILRRTPIMLQASLIGNLIHSIILMSNICEIEKSFSKEALQDCDMFSRLRQSLALLSHYLLFIPYVLRAYRISMIFKIDKEWESNEDNVATYIYRTKEKWMVAFLFIFILPVVVACVVIISSCEFSRYMPASESKDHRIFSESLYLAISFSEELLLMFMIYNLKEISDDYAMTKELTLVMVAWFITPIFVVFPIKDLKHLTPLPSLIRNLLLFLTSMVYPTVCSFYINSNDNIVTLEMIENIESVLQSKVPLEQFEKYLREIEGKANDSTISISGSELLQLYMKCEMFLNSGSGLDTNEIIFDLLKSEVVPLNYVRDSKENFDFQIQRAKTVILGLLKREFFSGFRKSSRFRELRRFVNCQEIYTGRLMKIGLTQTYSSLIRNSMSFRD